MYFQRLCGRRDFRVRIRTAATGSTPFTCDAGQPNPHLRPWREDAPYRGDSEHPPRGKGMVSNYRQQTTRWYLRRGCPALCGREVLSIDETTVRRAVDGPCQECDGWACAISDDEWRAFFLRLVQVQVTINFHSPITRNACRFEFVSSRKPVACIFICPVVFRTAPDTPSIPRGPFLCAAIRGRLLLVGTRQSCCYTQTENIGHFK